jgi:hypothetical protein
VGDGQKLAADLVRPFNLKHDTVCVKGLQVTVMSLENQTVSFAATSCFSESCGGGTAYRIGPYSVDLCFPDHRLVVECDEMGHGDRDARHIERTGQGLHSDSDSTDPNEAGFDFAIVMRKIQRTHLPLSHSLSRT